MAKTKMAITPQLEIEILTNIMSFLTLFPDSTEALRQSLGADHLPDVDTLKRNIDIRLRQLESVEQQINHRYHLH